MSLVTFTLSVCVEKQPHYGEDSLICHADAPNAALIACMDGCGGSGGRRYPMFENWSGARIASRIVGQAVSKWFLGKKAAEKNLPNQSIDSLASEMCNLIKQQIGHAQEQLPEDNSVVMSKLSRTFPSTLAAVMVEAVDTNLCRICSFWAGDSRTYFFPVSGLRQTSRDNIRGNGDPYDTLIRDGIMSNVICADRDFRIHNVENWSKDPFMVISATDGCFSYFPSPLYFEWTLLETLMNAKSPIEWENQLDQAIGSVAGDDYTIQIAIIGFSNFQAVQTAYAPRYAEFQKKYGNPLQEILQQGDQQAHYELWLEYKQSYMLEN